MHRRRHAPSRRMLLIGPAHHNVSPSSNLVSVSANPSIRPIVLLSAAAFASAATLRVADPLLPQIAGEFVTTAGGASVIATAFAVSYGLCQIFVGALGDRFGKYTVIAVATFLSGLTAASGA